jgi:hypothetical protein
MIDIESEKPFPEAGSIQEHGLNRFSFESTDGMASLNASTYRPLSINNNPACLSVHLAKALFGYFFTAGAAAAGGGD